MNNLENVIIYKNVHWGGSHTLGHFVIVGELPTGWDEDQAMTHIGKDALIRSHTVIYAGNQIGEHFQTGHHVLIREANEIGNLVSIGSGSVVEHHVKIGNRVRLHSNVFVPEFSILEDDCWIGPNVVLTNAKYPRSPHIKKQLIGPHIEAGAKIGANATILPGVRIGRNALVGAGAVVTRNVPEGVVVIGNPARAVKMISELPYVEEQR
jgi:acetyltransferase-like isoleucine patch superfamily enzyme